jgi:hypothetical protein
VCVCGAAAGTAGVYGCLLGVVCVAAVEPALCVLRLAQRCVTQRCVLGWDLDGWGCGWRSLWPT